MPCGRFLRARLLHDYNDMNLTAYFLDFLDFIMALIIRKGPICMVIVLITILALTGTSSAQKKGPIPSRKSGRS